ncbi:hypothetical protein HK102_011959, partial [Quaeritorhiza haematococci]
MSRSISSGNECMAFFWKGDQLFTKKGILPPPQNGSPPSPWTTFFLSLREPMDLPLIPDFGRFLSNSLAFTRNLRSVTVLFDNVPVLAFQKKIADGGQGKPLTFPRGLYQLQSPNRFFTLTQVVVTQVQLDVAALLEPIDWAVVTPAGAGAEGASPGDNNDADKKPDTSTSETAKTENANTTTALTTSTATKPSPTPTTFTLFMRTATATFEIRLPSTLAKEMERTTKKRPPSSTDINIMWSNWDEYE